MDVGDRDKVETDHKGNEDSMSYNTSRSNSEWQPSGATFTNFLMGMVTDGNPLAVCKGDVANPSPLISVSDSLGPAPALWEHPANNDHSGSTAFDKLGLTRLPGPLGAGFEARWEPPNSESKSGVFVPTGSGVFPHSISQFPADSAFIERAARFSCFSTGNIADMVDPYGVNQPVNAYHQVGMMPQDPHVIFGGNSARAASSGDLQKNEVNPASAPKGGSLSADHRSQEGSPNELEKKNGGIDVDTKQAGSDTVNSVGGGGQEETSLVDTGAQPSSAKGLDTKKRKRGGQDTEQPQQPLGEDVKNNGKHDSEAPPSNRAKFENGKQSSQASDPPKEEYIHIRARRGQATNSHSLAERVRREKISERMKFLQDLVPGCSKVTGKAVMLDEIINYVQSLQRQVEFLSMKLATVNPKLDFNIESLLAKDQMFGGRAGPPIMGFSADMAVVYPQLHPSQPTVIPPNLPVISSQLTSIREVYKEATPQVHSFWDDELHNVVQMGFNSSTPPDNQDANSSVPPGQTKVEH